MQSSASHESLCLYRRGCFPRSEDSVRIAEPLSGPKLDKYKALAQEHKLWLSLGGFQVRIDGSIILFFFIFARFCSLFSDAESLSGLALLRRQVIERATESRDERHE